jgi:hypothetical protein
MYKKVNKIIPHLVRQDKDSDTFTGEGTSPLMKSASG